MTHVDKETDAPMLLTVAETCERLRLSRSTVYRLLETRMLPSVRIGARRLVRVADLCAFVEARVESASQLQPSRAGELRWTDASSGRRAR